MTERRRERISLWCPFCEDGICVYVDGELNDRALCAHYNPETDECFHVEAARAQAQAARAQARIANALELLCDMQPRGDNNA